MMHKKRPEMHAFGNYEEKHEKTIKVVIKRLDQTALQESSENETAGQHDLT